MKNDCAYGYSNRHKARSSKRERDDAVFPDGVRYLKHRVTHLDVILFASRFMAIAQPSLFEATMIGFP